MELLTAFAFAFVFGGILAAIFQITAMITKAKPVTLLTVGFALGGVLVPTGVITWCEITGGGGMTAMVIDAGAALGGSFLTLFATGGLVPLLILLATFVALVLIGCLTGAVSKSQGPDSH